MAKKKGKAIKVPVEMAVKRAGSVVKIVGVIIFVYDVKTKGVHAAMAENVRDQLWPLPELAEEAAEHYEAKIQEGIDRYHYSEEEINRLLNDPLHAEWYDTAGGLRLGKQPGGK